MGPGAHLAAPGAHQQGVALAHADAGRVLGRDEEGVAVGAREGVVVAEDHRVELLAAPGREHQVPLGHASLGRLDHARSGRARRGSGTPSRRRGARRPTAPGRPSPSGSRCPCTSGRRSAISTRISCPEPQVMRCARSGSTRAARSVRISHSVRASPTFGPLICGAERDAPLGRGLGAAVALLVAGRGGQQHDDLAGIDEHLARHDDVLVHAHRRGGQARGHQPGVGQGVEEVAAARVEHLDAPVPRGLDHPLGVEARLGRHLEAPLLRELRRPTRGSPARRPGRPSRRRPSRPRPARRSAPGWA